MQQPLSELWRSQGSTFTAIGTGADSATLASRGASPSRLLLPGLTAQLDPPINVQQLRVDIDGGAKQADLRRELGRHVQLEARGLDGQTQRSWHV